MTSQARCTTFDLGDRRLGRSSGTASRPATTVLVPGGRGSESHDAIPGIGMPPVDRAVRVEVAEQGLGHVAARLRHQLDRRELRGLVVVDPARQRVADGHLDRRGDRGDGERDEEAEAVVAVAPTAQHAHRVDRRDQEAADDVRGHDHVRGLQRHGVVEDHARADRRSTTCPDRVQGEARRLVHPGVGGDHRDGAADARDHDRARRSRSGPTASGAASRRCRSRRRSPR